ncbi:MAG: phosphoribosyltransferase family protein [Psychrobacillus psychrodurans]
MAFHDSAFNNPNEIQNCGTYYPYRIKDDGGNLIRNPKFDNFSGLILDFKEGKTNIIDAFFHSINSQIKDDIAIAYVPSHDPEKLNSGPKMLAVKLASHGSRIDATSCLTRHTKIVKLANGGSRSKEVHLNSLSASNIHLIKNRTVLIIDDVTTSNNSLLACQEILLKSGAKSVHCLALAQTEG